MFTTSVNSEKHGNRGYVNVYHFNVGNVWMERYGNEDVAVGDNSKLGVEKSFTDMVQALVYFTYLVQVDNIDHLDN